MIMCDGGDLTLHALWGRIGTFGLGWTSISGLLVTHPESETGQSGLWAL